MRAHLDFISSEKSVIWKCTAATRKLKAAYLVWMTQCLNMLGDQGSPKQHHAFSLLHSGMASRREERDILDHAKLVCTFSQPLQMLSLKALCKCMRECLTQVLTRTHTHTHGCPLHQKPLDLRASFKHKLCDANSSDLSVWSSFAPFCICTAVRKGLLVLAFADWKRSHCKWIPNDSKPLLN